MLSSLLHGELRSAAAVHSDEERSEILINGIRGASTVIFKFKIMMHNIAIIMMSKILRSAP